MALSVKAVFYLVFFYTSLYAGAVASQTITYKNQRGSTLVLTWHEDKSIKEGAAGTITGTFISAVGKCATGLSLPVSGVFNGNAIAITLNLPECKQVIAMTGNTTENREEIHMLWLDAAQSADPQKKDWNSNIIGADHYKMEK